ncbi:MAG: choice-of-anchor B family protein [Leptolyngbya sp. SIO3F4]|nr:choice-of-anchor B family protein [Leptolyngbya sp. SIO3F4]
MIATGAAVSVASGHPDDPKARNSAPTYEGPGYRYQPGVEARMLPAGEADAAAAGGETFPSEGVALLGWMPINEFPGQSFGNDCWGYTSPSGREYAIMGFSDGSGFVDITNPTSPVLLEMIAGPGSIWRDMKVYDEYAYIVSEGGGGIQVVDLTDIDNGNVTLINEVFDGGNAATHNVAINEETGFLYRTGGSGNGLRFYDLADPANPVFVGAWQDRYVHDAQIVVMDGGPFAGREIAFCCAGFGNGGIETGLSIVDVTDKLNPVTLVHYQYPQGAYSHQGWLSEDQQYFYLNDEQDETDFGVTSRMHIIDVSDLENPFEVETFTNGLPSITHNLYVKGDRVFASNYSSGLRIFDISNPTSPTEVAFFDTLPANDGVNFNSLWSNYPYFESGVIIGSDRQAGLFIWALGENTVAFDYPDGLPAQLDPNGQTIEVSIQGAVPGTEKMFVDAGDGFMEAPFVAQGDGNYIGTFPAAECGAVVSYYFSAESDLGFAISDPLGAPLQSYEATVYEELLIGFDDNMESDTGWVVGAAGDNASSGIWDRVDPIGTAAQPENDNPDGTGTFAWITGQGSPGGGAGENDVDNGVTTLTSPTLDATAGDNAFLVFYRWYSNNQGASPGQDSMPISISDDNGATWTLLEDVSENAGAWVKKSFFIGAFVDATDEIRVRFVARDLDAGSLVEAGVDDVRIEYFECGDTILGDLDGDGTVGPADLAILLGQWGPCPGCVADLDGDDVVGPADLAVLLGAWG